MKTFAPSFANVFATMTYIAEIRFMNYTFDGSVLIYSMCNESLLVQISETSQPIYRLIFVIWKFLEQCRKLTQTSVIDLNGVMVNRM